MCWTFFIEVYELFIVFNMRSFSLLVNSNEMPEKVQTDPLISWTFCES
jgi:hypothetical protein